MMVGATDQGTDFSALVIRRIRAEYREMPGLCLTLAQASRFLGLETELCRDAMDRLVSEGYLIRLRNGYARPH